MDNENVEQPRAEGQETPLEALPMEQQLSELKARLEEAEREKDQFKALLQRTQAEFANYRKRAEAEREEQQRYANGRLLLKLVGVADDLARALSHEGGASDSHSVWLEGVRLIHRNLMSLLKSEGVVPIEAEGQPFDPSAHEAILVQESTHAPDGTVLAVARPGYRFHDRILRPAQVVVSKRPQTQQTDSPDTIGGTKENSNG